MTGRYICEDFLIENRIIDRYSEDGKRIHNFLMSRAKALVGDKVDFEETPVTFVLSDVEEPNAFHANLTNQRKFDINKGRDLEQLESHDFVVSTNPYDTPVICVTRGMINLIDNLDQLDYILGHELTHFIINKHIENRKGNSKGEEMLGDLHSIDLMANAGDDLKQALIMNGKLEDVLNKQIKEKKQKLSELERRGINISILLDPHVSSDNRRFAIETSLTRHSHNVTEEDTSKPIDKSIFDSSYTDAVDDYLRNNNYEKLSNVEKLKVLINAIRDLSSFEDYSPEEYAREKLKSLEAEVTRLESSEDEAYMDVYNKKQEIREISRSIESGVGYPSKPKFVMEKKYQQKLAKKIEEVFNEVGNSLNRLNYEINDELEMTISEIPEYQEWKSKVDILEKHAKEDGISKDERKTRYSEYMKAISEEPSFDEGEIIERYSILETSVNKLGLDIDKIYVIKYLPYFFNRAFEDINTYGYPSLSDDNYFDSSLVLYSFLFEHFNSINGLGKTPKLESDISFIHDIMQLNGTILKSENTEDILDAIKKRAEILETYNNLKSSKYGRYRFIDKFHNLSINTHVSYTDEMRFKELSGIYDIAGLPINTVVPWNNVVRALYETTNLEDRKRLRDFLRDQQVMDLRISKEINYVEVSRYDLGHNYRLTDDGEIISNTVPYYEIEYEMHRDVIEKRYKYIGEFFADSDGEIEKLSQRILGIELNDLNSGKKLKEYLDSAYNFISLYNSFPEEDKPRHKWDIPSVYDFMPKGILENEPIFSNKKNGIDINFTNELFKINNQIFIERFGENFESKILDIKKSQRERLFKLTLEIIKFNEDLYKKKLKEENSLGERSEEIYRVRQQKESIDSLLCNFTASLIHSDHDNKWVLNHLNAEERKVLATYIISDSNGIFREVFSESRLDYIADFLGVMSEQIERAKSSNYEWTNDVKMIASKRGYIEKNTIAELNEFRRDKHSDRGYYSYLYVLDSLRNLESNSYANFSNISQALTCINSYNSRYTNGRSGSSEIATAQYNNFQSLIVDTRFIPLFTKALEDKSNLGTSREDLLRTFDSIAQIRSLIVRESLLSEEYDAWGESKKYSPEHKEFLNLLEEKLSEVLSSIVNKSLEINNPSDRIRVIYNLYAKFGNSNQKGGDCFGKFKDDNDKFLVEKFFDDINFWPSEDVSSYIDAFILAKNSFMDNPEVENHIMTDILNRLELLPKGKKKNYCFFKLLDKSLRSPYPETRERLLDLYVQDIKDKIGADDGSDKYKARLALYLKAIDARVHKEYSNKKENLSPEDLLQGYVSLTDEYQILRKLADSIISQEQTSYMIKETAQYEGSSEDFFKSYFYGVGIDYLTGKLDKDSRLANRFISFFNSRGTKKDCEELSEYLKKSLKRDYFSDINEIDATRTKLLYENFWSAPIEARAVIVARLFKGAVKDNADDTKNPWEKVFDLVMDNLIAPSNKSDEAVYARDIMHSYISARSDYERELILSAMMVANRNVGTDSKNLGKALKLFLENMGPAEIKLGQAISSHPSTPDNIKKELQELKNAASIPARWTLYDWIKSENIPEELWKDKYLGEVLGSASYYTTVSLGDDRVLRILRPEAREKANKGFRVLEEMLGNLESRNGNKYGGLISSVGDMIRQARKMSSIETNHDAGEAQYRNAQGIYNGVVIESDGEKFSLKVMDWRVSGKNWIVMDRASGPVFNNLPEETEEQISYKKAFAKAYIVFEMANIIGGNNFDHDRHGAQLCIDDETNEVGIFDTGAMSLTPPSSEEQRVLGSIIYDLVKVKNETESFLSLGKIINDRISSLYKSGTDVRYLTEVQKAILALGDFFSVLDKSELISLTKDIITVAKISPDVKAGIAERMSIAERIKFGVASVVFSDRNSVEIRKAGCDSAVVSVQRVDSAPSPKNNAEWFDNSFMTKKPLESVSNASNAPTQLMLCV